MDLTALTDEELYDAIVPGKDELPVGAGNGVPLAEIDKLRLAELSRRHDTWLRKKLIFHFGVLPDRADEIVQKLWHTLATAHPKRVGKDDREIKFKSFIRRRAFWRLIDDARVRTAHAKGESAHKPKLLGNTDEDQATRWREGTSEDRLVPPATYSRALQFIPEPWAKAAWLSYCNDYTQEEIVAAMSFNSRKPVRRLLEQADHELRFNDEIFARSLQHSFEVIEEDTGCSQTQIQKFLNQFHKWRDRPRGDDASRAIERVRRSLEILPFLPQLFLSLLDKASIDDRLAWKDLLNRAPSKFEPLVRALLQDYGRVNTERVRNVEGWEPTLSELMNWAKDPDAPVVEWLETPKMRQSITDERRFQRDERRRRHRLAKLNDADRRQKLLDQREYTLQGSLVPQEVMRQVVLSDCYECGCELFDLSQNWCLRERMDEIREAFRLVAGRVQGRNYCSDCLPNATVAPPQLTKAEKRAKVKSWKVTQAAADKLREYRVDQTHSLIPTPPSLRERMRQRQRPCPAFSITTH